MKTLLAYLQLARLDKPIGTLLLLWPTLAALWLAKDGFPGWHLLAVFALGALFTRSAGCILNDLTDRQFDGRVARTRDRPLATGRIGVRAALAYAGVLLALALGLALTTNAMTVLLALPAVALMVIYPRMKRYTHLPQAVLGLAFSMGILMAFAAVQAATPQLAWLLVAANLLWVMAYDTEYAMVDREDDLKLGLKSTAILFADLDRLMIGVLQASYLGVLLLVPQAAGLSAWYYAGVLVAAGCFVWQQRLIQERTPAGCFAAFLNNQWAGLAVFLGVVAGLAL